MSDEKQIDVDGEEYWIVDGQWYVELVDEEVTEDCQYSFAEEDGVWGEWLPVREDHIGIGKRANYDPGYFRFRKPCEPAISRNDSPPRRPEVLTEADG